MNARGRIRISLAPDAAALVRVSGLWRKRARGAAWRPVTPVPGQPAWVAALAALPGLIEQSGIRNARANVVLSNQFVRFLVVPGGNQLGSVADQIAYARARLAQIHGDAARDWEVRVGRDPAGSSRLAAAVDGALLETLRTTLEARKVRITDCRPALTATFDALRRRMPREAWIVCAENNRMLVARIRRGQWASVRTQILHADTLALAEIIAKECLLLPDAAGDCPIYVAAAAGLRIEADGLRTQVFGATQRAGLPPDLHAHAALAMAGLA